MASLKRIGTANGHWIDIKDVKMPDYEPFSDLMMAEESPVLLVWVAGEFPTTGRIGMADRMLEVWIAGIIQAQSGIQGQLMKLLASVRSVMLSNRQMNYPDQDPETPNTWGRGTAEHADGAVYEITKFDKGRAAGIFLSKWNVSYAFQPPVG